MKCDFFVIEAPILVSVLYMYDFELNLIVHTRLDCMHVDRIYCNDLRPPVGFLRHTTQPTIYA